MRVYLELVRFPNLFTVVADVLAGFLYAGGTAVLWDSLLGVVAASAALYGGGVALNDVCDVAQDRSERPARPIPSGRISRARAGLLAGTLLVLGVGLAGFVSLRLLAVASVLVGCIVLYNGAFKRSGAGPVVMGACRGLNLALGMGVASSLLTWTAVTPALLHGAYIASVTFFAAREAEEPGRHRLAVGGGGVTVSAAGLAFLYLLKPHPHATYLLGTLTLSLIVGVAAVRAVYTPQPKRVQQAVRTFLLMLVAFDACIAWSAAGIYAAAAVLLLIIPALGFSRMFRMT